MVQLNLKMRLIEWGTLCMNKEFVKRWIEVQGENETVVMSNLAILCGLTVECKNHSWTLHGDWSQLLQCYATLEKIQSNIEIGQRDLRFGGMRDQVGMALKDNSQMCDGLESEVSYLIQDVTDNIISTPQVQTSNDMKPEMISDSCVPCISESTKEQASDDESCGADETNNDDDADDKAADADDNDDNDSVMEDEDKGESTKEVETEIKHPHTRVTKFVCKQSGCYARFAYESEFAKHMWSVHTVSKSDDEEDVIRCCHCDYVTATRKLLQGHIRMRHRKKHYPCPRCNEGFHYKSHLKSHMTSAHCETLSGSSMTHDRSHQCDDCEYVGKSRVALSQHKLRKHLPKQFKCHLCKKFFSIRPELQRHLLVKHQQTLYVCKACDLKFASAHKLRVHSQSHTADQRYPCEICGKLLSSKFTLQQHLDYLHYDKERKKTPCSFIERSFLCNFCGKDYKSKKQLEFHENRHLNVKPYTCDRCDKAYDNAASLHSHVATHNEIQSHVCSQCGAAYRTKNVLMAHVHRIHDEKRHTCDICGRAYGSLGLLNSHRKTHSDLRPFVCALCNNSYKIKKHLKRHLSTAHQVAWDSYITKYCTDRNS